jgi:integrase
MSAVRHAVEHYLALRRSLGFKLEAQTFMLRDFVRFYERRRATRLTTALALEWAQRPTRAQPAQWARRLGVLRGFASHWSATERSVEVPPRDLMPYRASRAVPHIYTPDEISRLMAAASRLPSATGLRAATYRTLIGLLVVTGLRISEAIALDDPGDVDLRAGVLTIRRTKFGKSRIVPLHRSSVRALQTYRCLREHLNPVRRSPAFLVGEQGRRLTCWSARLTFNLLACRTGLRDPSASRGPRLHDFRHRFAVTSLLRCYRAGADAERLMPRLATFLGHGHLSDTYWYLSAVPELLRLATRRLERAQEVES